MDKAKKAYTKLFKQWSKWSQERYGTKKKKGKRKNG